MAEQKRTWQQKWEQEYGRMTKEDVQREKRDREIAEHDLRTRCRCKEPTILRRYLGAGACLLCGLPNYAV